jgi:predicted RND superfamily exporter protein
MKKNVGSADKIIRIIVGIIIIILGLVFKSWWGIIGILPILTAMIGWCPPYALLGISTRKEEAKDDSPDEESSE